MKVFSNGFNLYGQLNNPEVVISDFTSMFESEVIKDFCINHSFSVFQTLDECLVCYGDQKWNIESQEIAKISSNDERMLLLDINGNMTRMDLEHFDEHRRTALPKLLGVVDVEECDDQVVNISCGSKITVAYSRKGKLFNVPNQLNWINDKIIQIECGREHCLCLDSFGCVYSFGRGSRGQLGHSSLDDLSIPYQIDALAGIKIARIAVGGWHSCALSSDGDLYIWGWNGNGQLGLPGGAEGSVAVIATPHVLDLQKQNVLDVACGSRHTIVLLENNNLYGCGWNKYKQLKNNSQENIYSFTHLHSFTEKQAIALKCGPWNSAFLCG